jgi:ligand-binding sensor domain-containing protein
MKQKLNFLIPTLFLVLFIFPSCKKDPDPKTTLAGTVIRSISIETNGTKWFATDKGISSFDGTTWTNFDEKDGLPVAAYNDISGAAAGEGIDLWLATTKGAIATHLETNILSVENSYTADNSDILSDTVLAIALDKSGYLWIGTTSGLTGLKNNTEWILPAKDVFRLPISHIGSSADGWNYFATLGAGVGRNKTTVDGISAASTYEMPWAGLPSDIVNTVYVDPGSGNQWFGTPAGAAYHVGTETKKNWTVYTMADGLVNDEILSITGDADGNIWFGTKGGVSKLSNSAWTSYTTTDGLAGNTVYAIAVDLDGSVWFGTDKGASHFTAGTWINY